MAEIKEFVVNDRRKVTAEGEIRPDTATPEEKAAKAAEAAARSAEPTQPAEEKQPDAVAQSAATDAAEDDDVPPMPPPPTADQSDQAKRAFDATVDRLDTAIRATNPGMDRMPEMTFERVVQSLYMQALIQLGAAGAPDQQPQLDLLGARQTIDMLGILGEKTKGNLAPSEETLLQTALFEVRMAFLEVTQAIARQAAARQQGGAPGMPPAPGGPSIVR
jgi:hypothetical protein